MPRIIKLENLVFSDYDRLHGGRSAKATVEFVCSSCRHLIDKADKFCWHCGDRLEPSKEVEHYSKGKKLTTVQFKKAKDLQPEEMSAYIQTIPEDDIDTRKSK